MKIIKTLLKALLLLTALGYFIFAIVKVSRSPQEAICTGIEYQFVDTEQVRLIEQNDVNKLLGKHQISPKGKTLANIDVRHIEQLLFECPYIDTVNCYHTASGKLHIRIKALHPLLHVFASNGDEFYVDNEGRIMPAGGRNVDLAVVTGHVTQEYAANHLVPLGRYLEENDYWNKLVEQIYIDQKGNVEIIPRFAEQNILLGKPQNYVEKLERVRSFYEKGMPKIGWNKYKTINAAYEGQIICTKK